MQLQVCMYANREHTRTGISTPMMTSVLLFGTTYGVVEKRIGGPEQVERVPLELAAFVALPLLRSPLHALKGHQKQFPNPVPGLPPADTCPTGADINVTPHTGPIPSASLLALQHVPGGGALVGTSGGGVYFYAAEVAAFCGGRAEELGVRTPYVPRRKAPSVLQAQEAA